MLVNVIIFPVNNYAPLYNVSEGGAYMGCLICSFMPLACSEQCACYDLALPEEYRIISISAAIFSNVRSLCRLTMSGGIL